MNFETLGLKSNPFRLTPPLDPKEIIWAGMKKVKDDLETRIQMSMRMAPSRIVINWGTYGSGKTHASLYFSKTERLNELSDKINVKEAKSFKVTLPRTSNDIVQEFLRSFLGQYSLEQMRDDFELLIGQFDEEKVKQLIDVYADDTIIKKVVNGIAFNKNGSKESEELKNYIYGDKTKGTLNNLELPYGLQNDELIANLLGTIISCLTYEKKLYSSFFIWLDEFEDIDTLKKSLQDRFTTFLRQFIDKTPNNFTLFINFTQKAFMNTEDLSSYLGEALSSRARRTIDFQNPTDDEAIAYIKELYEPSLLNQEKIPFESDDTLNYVVKHIGDLTARKINETFSIILEMAIITGTDMVTPKFIEEIRDEIIAWEE